MPSPDAAARHTGAGVARRQAHHERMRDERAREAAAGDAELPPEDDAVEMASAVHVLDSVAEVGPNYTLLRSKETKAKRRKRKREDARAALDGHTVLSTGSRLEIFCDSERWYPATVMAREEDGDGRIVHEVEYDGYSDRRWWHMLDDERWRAVPEQAGAGAGGATCVTRNPLCHSRSIKCRICNASCCKQVCKLNCFDQCSPAPEHAHPSLSYMHSLSSVTRMVPIFRSLPCRSRTHPPCLSRFDALRVMPAVL